MLIASDELTRALRTIEERLAEALRLADDRDEFLVAALIADALDAARDRGAELGSGRDA